MTCVALAGPGLDARGDGSVAVAPYDVAPAGTSEFRAGAAVGYLDAGGDADSGGYQAAVLAARWWPTTGLFVGVRQMVLRNATAPYAAPPDLRPRTSGFDDAVLEAGYLDASPASVFGLRVRARAPTGVDGLSPHRLGLALTALGVRREGILAFSVMPELALRPTSRFDYVRAELRLVVGFGVERGGFHLLVTPSLAQTYRTFERPLSGHLAGGAALAVWGTCGTTGFGVEAVARHDRRESQQLGPTNEATLGGFVQFAIP